MVSLNLVDKSLGRFWRKVSFLLRYCRQAGDRHVLEGNVENAIFPGVGLKLKHSQKVQIIAALAIDSGLKKEQSTSAVKFRPEHFFECAPSFCQCWSVETGTMCPGDGRGGGGGGGGRRGGGRAH